MIELVVAENCNACGKCVEICPTDVFELVDNGPVQIARKNDCQNCMNCELYCPTDALYVSPMVVDDPVTKEEIIASGLLGSYRKRLGWENGRAPRGTGDNGALQVREHKPDKKPPVEDKIRTQLYEVKDRTYI
jgi:NAD-dependent dihydropyrimidine dehydrogenase PreA subunit